MSWVIYFFGSGAAFFLGAGAILTGAALACFPRRKRLARLAAPIVVLGLILVALSAAPLPSWFYAVSAGVTLAWIVTEESKKEPLRRHRKVLRASAACLWLAGVAMELPYQALPRIKATGGPKLYVIGDSVSAGTGDRRVETWPALLARSRSIDVIDCSRMGATTASAVRQAEELPDGEVLVLLELGGNDLLGATSADQFERDLDRLLRRVSGQGRVVLMFELPLPPLRNEYGRIQRRLASRHGTLLVPKRIFLSVLTTNGATSDGVHLTAAGHERMAEVVWGLIRQAYSDD